MRISIFSVQHQIWIPVARWVIFYVLSLIFGLSSALGSQIQLRVYKDFFKQGDIPYKPLEGGNEWKVNTDEKLWRNLKKKDTIRCFYSEDEEEYIRTEPIFIDKEERTTLIHFDEDIVFEFYDKRKKPKEFIEGKLLNPEPIEEIRAWEIPKELSPEYLVVKFKGKTIFKFQLEMKKAPKYFSLIIGEEIDLTDFRTTTVNLINAQMHSFDNFIQPLFFS